MSPEDLMRKAAQAVEHADYQFLRSILHERIVWKSGSLADKVFRFSGSYSGQGGALEVTSKLAMSLQFQRLQPIEIIVAGEVVWGLFDVQVVPTFPAGGACPASLRFEMALRWRVRDDKVLEHQSFFDTALLAAYLSAGRGDDRLTAAPGFE